MTNMRKEGITYALGAYGTGNVGDDAILAGLKLRIGREVVAIVDSAIETGPYLPYDYLLTKRIVPGQHDSLIIGGGGIFHSKIFIRNVELISEQFLVNGAGYEVRCVGLEYLDVLCRDAEVMESSKRIFVRAKAVSCRSRASLALLRELFGVSGVLEADFSINIKIEVTIPSLRDETKRLTLGVVTGGGMSIASELVDSLRQVVKCGVKLKLIPHSRSFADENNNDIISNEMLSRRLQVGDECCETLPFRGDFRRVLDDYLECDLIYTERLHGAYFSLLSKRPVLCAGHNAKMNSFHADYRERFPVRSANETSIEEFVGEYAAGHRKKFRAIAGNQRRCEFCGAKLNSRNVSLRNSSHVGYSRFDCPDCGFSSVENINQEVVDRYPEYKSLEAFYQIDREQRSIRTQLFINDNREFVDQCVEGRLHLLDICLGGQGVGRILGGENTVVDVDLFSSSKQSRSRYDMVLVRDVLPHLRDTRYWLGCISDLLAADSILLIQNEFSGNSLNNEDGLYGRMLNNFSIKFPTKKSLISFFARKGYSHFTQNGRPILFSRKNLLLQAHNFPILNSLFSKAFETTTRGILCIFKEGFWGDERLVRGKYFRWTSDAEAFVELHNLGASKNVTLTLEILMSNFPRNSTMKVYLNGVEVITAGYEMTSYAIRLSQRVSLLRICTDSPLSPREIRGANDDRKLGLAVNLRI